MIFFRMFAPKRILATIALLFLASGLIRIGTVGYAFAKDAQKEVVHEAMVKPASPSVSNEIVDELLANIAERTKVLDQREAALRDRATALALSEQVIEKNLVRLERAEASLKATISQVDGASEDDLDKLTKMYASMKPKIAAQLFEQMTPEFAAGFLGRMAADAAGGILSGLSAEKAYAISVVLAGRNATAPKQ